MRASLNYGQAEYQRAARAIAHRLREWLPVDPSSCCLDVGCGGGQMLFALELLGFSDVVGIDVSAEQVALARQVSDVVHEVEATSFLRDNPERFDLITALDVVEHFRKDELFDLLDGLYSALKPGGRVILQTPNAESPWGLMHRYHDITHEVAFDPYSLEHVLSLSGFCSFEARECGPYIHGPTSLARWAIWRSIRAGLYLWNLAEMGTPGSGVYTRVFVAKADKPLTTTT